MTQSSLPVQVKAEKYVNHIKDLLNMLHSEMLAVQAKYKDDTAQDRLSAPILCVGDQVWLDTKNICTKRSAHKLDWKNLRQFTIKTVLSLWAYKLDLSETMQIHSVFHVLKLSLIAMISFSDQVQPPSQPIKVDEDISWEVKKILNFKCVQREYIQYLVSWVEYDTFNWESASNIDNCNLLLKTFHHMYLTKPKLKSQSCRA